MIGLQEELGLDVLVHGEAERNDMVQYFAENLAGFAVTRNGWVQSYGSRATRPSILWAMSRPAPITVRWSEFAQSLSDRPVKGMLTGPVTILAWSFVRDDQPLGETADQVALALRDEIGDLEAAGIGIIQVDELALRELLPLKQGDQQAYLDWSVGSFRLATAGAAVATQVHTHLCYSEFAVVIDAIAALDADVTSIEAARSRGEVIDDIAASGFSHGVGPGVYDIHSPRVPSVAEVAELLQRAVYELPLRQVWVNPDCGLKTRAYPETVASLHNIIEATRLVREGRRDSRLGRSPLRTRGLGRGGCLDRAPFVVQCRGIRCRNLGFGCGLGVGRCPDGCRLGTCRRELGVGRGSRRARLFGDERGVLGARCNQLVRSLLQPFEQPRDDERDDDDEEDIASRQRTQREEPEHREHGDDDADEHSVPREGDPERSRVQPPRREPAACRRVDSADEAA